MPEENDNLTPNDKPVAAATAGSVLARRSECFHAFEWLHAVSLKGNKHAKVLCEELRRLNGDALKIAFIQGAKWWEFKSTGATMWPSDQEDALKEAEHRVRVRSLGVDPLNTQGQTRADAAAGSNQPESKSV